MGPRALALRHRERGPHREALPGRRRARLLRAGPRLPPDVGERRRRGREAARRHLHPHHRRHLRRHRLPAPLAGDVDGSAALRDGGHARRHLPLARGDRRPRRGPQRHQRRAGAHHRAVPDAAVARERAVAEPPHTQHGSARRDARPPAAGPRGPVRRAHGGGVDIRDPRGHGGRGGGLPRERPADAHHPAPARHERRGAHRRRGCHRAARSRRRPPHRHPRERRRLPCSPGPRASRPSGPSPYRSRRTCAS